MGWQRRGEFALEGRRMAKRLQEACVQVEVWVWRQCEGLWAVLVFVH